MSVGTYLLHLLLGFTLSFIGSLPIGMINMTVAETTIRKGMKAGLIIALGASLVELLQALVAIKFSSIFTSNPDIGQFIQWIAVPILLGLGLYYLTRKEKPQQQSPETPEKAAKLPQFSKGLFISALNVLAIPYWIFYGSYLRAEGWLMTNSSLLIFATGVMLGTFVLLWLYARLSLAIVSKVQRIAHFTNQFIGIIMLLFGIFQLIRVL
ncbi:MAG: LysE family transporter [Bacteroidota bacterium]